MRIKIAPYVEGSRTVDVTFSEGGKKLERPVNATFDSDGRYDAAATAATVDDVARGVSVGFAAGLFDAPPMPPAPPVGLDKAAPVPDVPKPAKAAK